MKNILLEVPTWLGDAVMMTPAVENIIAVYPDIKITIFDAKGSAPIFQYHQNVVNITIGHSRAA